MEYQMGFALLSSYSSLEGSDVLMLNHFFPALYFNHIFAVLESRKKVFQGLALILEFHAKSIMQS